MIDGDPVSPHPARLRFADPTDVDGFVEALAGFERGELTSDDWKRFRRLRGVYDQRQDGRAMIRVKVPGGAITAAQLRTVADVAERHAGGIAHVTTRQCFQLHFVPTDQVPAALAALADGGRPFALTVVAEPTPRQRLPIAPEPLPEFAAWAARAVAPQRQAGFAIARLRLPLGDLTAPQLRALATITLAHGDGELRTTIDQDAILRWLPIDRLPLVHRALVAAGLDRTGVGTTADVTSCPGATSCQLAVTASRGAARALAAVVEAIPVDDLTIKISGCPNSCGQHHVAAIGLQGGVRKLGGRAVPQYLVHVGGATTPTGARFGRLVAKVPARRLPAAIARLGELALRERGPGESSSDTLARLDDAAIVAALGALTELTAADATADDFVDLDDGDRRATA